jgi:peptide deformylase
MSEFIYNTADVVSQAAAVPGPQFLGYELCDQKDPILTTKLEHFDFTNTELNSSEIASKLIATCKFHKVYGIAANQCGLEHKVLVAGVADNFVAFFNPIVIESHGEILLEESDLSNMGLLMAVKRPTTVIVSYQDFQGNEKMTRFDGLTSRIIQQGIDRLNGIDFKTKVSKFVLERAETALNKKIKKIVKSHMIMQKRGKNGKK